MARIRIYPYKSGSRSARALADALGGRVLRLEGSTFRPRQGDLIINWGSSRCPFQDRLNSSSAVVQASDKLCAFDALQEAGVRVPRFWTSRDEIPHEDVRYPIVCRTVLNGHSGRGIVLADTPDQIVDAPLFVEYIPKQDEYRIHVINGVVVATQRKARRLDVENPNWRIRNHDNGFNFAREGVIAPDDAVVQSINAVAALGLDFGAVDVVWNERRQLAYVLECNTAPGLEGQTVLDYRDAFLRLIRA